VTGRKPSLLKSGLHDQAFYAQMWRTITAGKTWAGRLINKKKDGALFHEDAIITPMRQKDGNISHYVAAKRDVTAHVQLENQLRQSQRIEAIGSLAGGIAHDFNNILSGIMGYTEMCLYEAADDSPLRGRLDKVLQASHRAKDLIRHIQTFSRQTKFERKPFLLHSVVKEASKLLRASIPSSIEFKTRVDKVGVVLGDPTQIHQVIMNLCTNAYHAMKETDGVLSVTLDKESVSADSALCRLGLAPGPCARLVVGDTGCGIPEEVKEKIFDPYFTTKPEGEGSGLGLAVVHGIVNGLGGHIDVSSEVGKGTTFTIHLPLTESKADTGRARKAPITKGNQETVLVVDDDTTVLEITSEMLIGLNYRPVARSSAIEALHLFKSKPEHFSAVLTDLTMPGMNGVKLAGEIKKVSPDIPVFLCSGFGDNQAVDTAVRNGLVIKLDKPIVLYDLAKNIRQGLKG
jgi:signal transduction histidine kinase/CheY-like chemotaxis protein